MNQSPNIAASVRTRLKNQSTSAREDFQVILTRYALERFLYRISQSLYQEQFILKGALLFSVWSDQPHRPTMGIYPAHEIYVVDGDDIVTGSFEENH